MIQLEMSSLRSHVRPGSSPPRQSRAWSTAWRA